MLGIALWKDLTVDRWQIRTKIAPEAPAKDVSLPPNQKAQKIKHKGVWKAGSRYKKVIQGG